MDGIGVADRGGKDAGVWVDANGPTVGGDDVRGTFAACAAGVASGPVSGMAGAIAGLVTAAGGALVAAADAGADAGADVGAPLMLLIVRIAVMGSGDVWDCACAPGAGAEAVAVAVAGEGGDDGDAGLDDFGSVNGMQPRH